MSERLDKEERAFEGFVVDALRKIEKEEICIDNVRELNETEEEALRLLGDDFIDRLLSDRLVSQNQGAAHVAKDSMPAVDLALFRSDGVDEETQRKLDEADREIIERKKRERDGEAS